MWMNEKSGRFEIGNHELVVRSPERDFCLAFPETVSENVRRILMRLERESGLPNRLGVTSALQEEGVTYISRALAAVLAHDLEAQVCVVELNWWQPAALPAGSPGLAAVLDGESSLEAALIGTEWPELSLLPAGQLQAQRRHVAARGPGLEKILTRLEEQFDHLILDIPAVLGNSDAIALAALAESVILVIRQGVTHVEQTQLALDDLQHLNLAGVVLNAFHLHTPRRITQLIP